MGNPNRIREWREKQELTLEGLAHEAGLSVSYLSRMEVGERNVSLKNLAKLARALKIAESDLVPGSATQQLAPTLIPAGRDFSFARVDGAVQAGAFLQVDTLHDVEGEVISAPRDPDFPFARQIAYRNRGDSMNKAEPKPIKDGDYLICVDFADTGLEPADEMIVVVQQTINGGMLRERSVKELVLFDDRAEFHPRSDNPAHRPIVVPRNLEPDDGREVSILALLRFVFDNKPLPIGRKR